jgi:hypothetical protein
MRRYLAGIFIVLGLAVASVSANEYWVSKEWKNWSKSDCKKMLQESPWAFKWEQAQVAPSAATPGIGGSESQGAGGETNLQVQYFIQDRSSIPVREAYIRQLQIDGNYDKMDDAHKKAFDAQANDLLNRTFGDEILIHVEYASNVQNFMIQLATYWKNIPPEKVPANVYLINQRGNRIPPTKFVSPKNGGYSFDLYFPRSKDGAPIVQESDKLFSIEFTTPPVGSQRGVHVSHDSGPGDMNMKPLVMLTDHEVDIPNNPNTATLGAERVLAQFKVEKMMWKGKPSF